MYGMTDLILRDRGLGAALPPIAVMVAQGLLCLAASAALLRRRLATD